MRFSTGRDVCGTDALPPKILCPSATVVRVHDGALAEEYAMSSTTLVVADSDDHSYGPVDINMVGYTLVRKFDDDSQGIPCLMCDS